MDTALSPTPSGPSPSFAYKNQLSPGHCISKGLDPVFLPSSPLVRLPVELSTQTSLPSLVASLSLRKGLVSVLEPSPLVVTSPFCGFLSSLLARLYGSAGIVGMPFSPNRVLASFEASSHFGHSAQPSQSEPDVIQQAQSQSGNTSMQNADVTDRMCASRFTFAHGPTCVTTRLQKAS
ncbi:unnamed protein product [Protopolystoma xenopodis]|uniref:Uncharacterized protein n=1 Tax=Protopolystoma xenopodis TaxID=117903 RepID=A0A448WQU1_9PLAT|nr:unnamed protein product [Protopolystoma xenopodis]